MPKPKVKSLDYIREVNDLVNELESANDVL